MNVVLLFLVSCYHSLLCHALNLSDYCFLILPHFFGETSVQVNFHQNRSYQSHAHNSRSKHFAIFNITAFTISGTVLLNGQFLAPSLYKTYTCSKQAPSLPATLYPQYMIRHNLRYRRSACSKIKHCALPRTSIQSTSQLLSTSPSWDCALSISRKLAPRSTHTSYGSRISLREMPQRAVLSLRLLLLLASERDFCCSFSLSHECAAQARSIYIAAVQFLL